MAGFKRLRPYLASEHGGVEVALEFDIDEQGRPHVRGRIQAHLELVCQRCLEPMGVALDLEPHLGVVESEPEAEHLPEEYDPLVVGEDPLFLADLIEDELVLSLPIVPRHADERCAGVEGGKEQNDPADRENPFAALAVLKRDSNPDEE